MGKLLCDPTASVTSSPAVPWREPNPSPPPESAATSLDQLQETCSNLTSSTWETVKGLEDQQIRQLVKLHDKGILWKLPENKNNSSSCKPCSGCPCPRSVVFRLTHGGEVSADGNCLFTASAKAMMGECAMDAKELRRRTVRRFLEDLGSANEMDKDSVNKAIRNMYCPDLKSGWGVHVVQEVKLLAKKQDRRNLDDAIDELVNLGMIRELAAESIYKERCIAVEDGSSWAKYMSISGSLDDEYDMITLQYTEEGLLSLDENREGHGAAFGDDIAIECLATEFKREIFVVQAHGSDAMVDEDNCVFFLPHSPRSEICELPIFLFMKGTGWCGAGADHYEPLIAHSSSVVSHEKVALVL